MKIKIVFPKFDVVKEMNDEEVLEFYRGLTKKGWRKQRRPILSNQEFEDDDDIVETPIMGLDLLKRKKQEMFGKS